MNYKQPIRTKTSIQQDQDNTHQVTTKNKILYEFFNYFIAAILIVAFFAHEFDFIAPAQTQNYIDKLNYHSLLRKERTKALKAVKDIGKETPEYAYYLTIKRKTDTAYQDLLTEMEKEKFLGFTNFNQFLGEFGWSFSLLVYAIFNLYRARMLRQDPSTIFIHKAVLVAGFYFVIYTISPFRDYPKYMYFFTAIFASILVIIGVNQKLREHTANILKLKFIKGLVYALKRDIANVKSIASIMPENENTITFKAMLDVEAEYLQKTANEIETNL